MFLRSNYGRNRQVNKIGHRTTRNLRWNVSSSIIITVAITTNIDTTSVQPN